MVSGIITGILAGYVASRITNGEGKGCFGNLIVGVIGGAFGDWLFGLFGMTWHLVHNWIGAVCGAVIFLWLWNKLTK